MSWRLMCLQDVLPRDDHLAVNFLTAIRLAATACYWQCIYALNGRLNLSPIRSNSDKIRPGRNDIVFM